MIDDQTLARMLTHTRELRRRFAATAPRPWAAVTAGAELAVQLGHLALCLARRRGVDVSAFDDPGRPITDIGDELADVALAALSVAVLTGVDPDHATPENVSDAVAHAGATTDASGHDNSDEETAGLLLLAAAAGRLVEAAMVADGSRHQPTGCPPPVSAACTTTLAAADRLAELLGVGLAEQFEEMACDAHLFLDQTTKQQREMEGGL